MTHLSNNKIRYLNELHKDENIGCNICLDQHNNPIHEELYINAIFEDEKAASYAAAILNTKKEPIEKMIQNLRITNKGSNFPNTGKEVEYQYITIIFATEEDPKGSLKTLDDFFRAHALEEALKYESDEEPNKYNQNLLRAAARLGEEL